MFKRLSVMKPQILDVENRKPVRLEDAHDLANRRRICAGKNSPFDSGIGRQRRGAPDGMNQTSPSRFERSRDSAAEVCLLFEADVLKHSDGNERITTARHVSPIVLDEFNTIGQAFALGAFPSIHNLLV